MFDFELTPDDSQTQHAGGADSVHDIESFLTALLPSPGPGRVISIHWKQVGVKDDADKVVFPGRAFESVAAAAKFAAGKQGFAKRKNNGVPAHDLYIAMSYFNGAQVHETKYGKQLRVSRSRSLVSGKTGFYADLDVKPGAFGSVQEALDRVDALVASGELLEPTIWVCSGNGVHLHWLLDTELQDDTRWFALSRRLSITLIRLGIHHDAQATNDIVRLLRIPGTFNCKNPSAPLPVGLVGPIESMRYTLAQFEASLDAAGSGTAPVASQGGIQWVGSGPAPGSAPGVPQAATAAPTGVVVPFPSGGKKGKGKSRFAAGIAPQAKPVDMREVVLNCPTLLDIAKRRGNGDPEPLWSLMVLATTFAVDGRRWAHALSMGDPRYTAADTNAKFDQKEADKAAAQGSIGWPTCASIDLACPSGAKTCAGCPRLALGKSPLARVQADPSAPIHADLPDRYFRKDKQVWVRVEADEVDDQGQPITSDQLVLAYDVRDAYLEYTEQGLTLNMEVVHSHGECVRLAISAASVNTWQVNALNALAKANIVTKRGHQQQRLQEFFVAFIQQLQEKIGVLKRREQYGWTRMRDESAGFAYGGVVYGNGVREEAGKQEGELAQIYHPEGSLDVWKAVAAFVTNKGRPEIDAVVASAFAAPLIHYTGVSGMIVSAYSPESGCGKSLALETALAVWGHPTHGKNKLSDTMNQTNRKIGILRNLPIYWDEIQSQEVAAAFAQLGFSLTMGVEKGRLNADSSIKASGSWATLLTVATNQSIREIMARNSSRNSDAGVNRVLEFHVGPIPKHAIVPMAVAQDHQRSLHTNYGHAGALYSEFLAKHAGAHAGRMATIINSLSTACNANPGERFWIVAAATLLLGATYSNALKLTAFDLASLRTFLLKSIDAQRETRAGVVVSYATPNFAADILNRYISYCRAGNACLETRNAPANAGKLPTIELKMRPEVSNALRDPKIHIIHDAGVIRILGTEFRKWVQEVEKLQFETTAESLKRAANMQLVRLVWASGTSWRTGQTSMYELHVGKGTPLEQYFVDMLA